MPTVDSPARRITMNMAVKLRLTSDCHEWQNGHTSHENCHPFDRLRDLGEHQMKTVAVIVQDGFAPFEFGVACEAFGLDRSDDGIPNFDFRVVAPSPGVVQSKLGFSLNVEHDLSFAYEADLVVVSPTPREYWAQTDERVLDAVRDAVTRGAWVLSVCSGSFILGA